MRAQAHTLEGLIAGLIVLSSLTFALQAMAVTPLTASTSSQHIENQQRASTTGLLNAAADSGALKRAVLYWDDTERTFHGSNQTGYYVSNSELSRFTFGRMLTNAYDGRGIAFNVYVNYQLADGDVRSKRLVYRGEPSDNAITARKWITLTDGDRLYDVDEQPTGTELNSSSTFYAPDVRSGHLYNVVQVEVVVWRI
ncbi:hypothetical protein HUG10_19815 (plasmid) [Halorarum halophilum]|uniref:Uncharacterized protein n=1 Tax=Halorarum halophilum TaxID=2743090 RepID=A0A7D5KAG7_9EURY|nr:hypothetical protein [Halobaculum halophilum]QLG29859.1 hypothetical protein HUG10_19815 [Halobaculum halophilum]